MSRRILLRLVVALLILAGIVLATRDFIVQLYLQNQLTSVGWVINGVILALFLLGLLRIAWLLLRYAREESALQRYVAHMEDGSGDPLHGISINTLIARRHEAVMALRARHAPVNHSALAAATVAGELCSRLYAGGVRHFHFYTLNRAPLVYAICHLMGLRPQDSAVAAVRTAGREIAS